jgi:hypothetical protein
VPPAVFWFTTLPVAKATIGAFWGFFGVFFIGKSVFFGVFDVKIDVFDIKICYF